MRMSEKAWRIILLTIFLKTENVLLNSAVHMLMNSWLQAASFTIFHCVIVTAQAESKKYPAQPQSFIY